VFLSDFYGVEKVPLEEYGERVEPFDPRNDGYAEKLRAFFVRGGRRFAFFPMKSGSPQARARLRKAAAAALEERGSAGGELRFLFPGSGGGGVFPGLVFLAAFCVFVYLTPGRGEKAAALARFPVLAALGKSGFAGFGLAALLAIFGLLVREPLKEAFASGRFRPGWGDLRETLRLFRRQCAAAGILAAFMPVIALAGGLTSLAALAGVAGFVLSLLPLAGGDFLRGRAAKVRPRFVPLLILPPKRFDFLILKPALPLAAGALAVFLFTRVLGLFSVPPPETDSLPVFDKDFLVTAADFEAHAAYQAAFAFTPLWARDEGASPSGGRESAVLPQDYLSYTLGEDGLISGAVPAAKPESEAGVFPLERLMAFLLTYSGRVAGE
jgi:hypothetical protein